jgi:hypothetical protein
MSLAGVCAGCDGSPIAPGPPLPETITLSGLVTERTPSGPVPLAGVSVVCPDCRTAPATTDDQGRYRVSGIPVTLKSIEVSASKLGYISRKSSAVISGDTQFDIELDRTPTYALSGMISERTVMGLVPVAGALVECRDCRPWAGKATTSTRTDDQGRYSIRDILPAPVNIEVLASKSGYLTGKNLTVINGDTQVDIELDRRPAYTLSGVISEVTSSGPVGIAGVEVWIFNYVANDNWSWGSTTTDAQGRYSLPGAWSGSDANTDLWLTKEGFRIDRLNSCEGCFRVLRITGDTELNIRLERLPVPAGVAASHTRHPFIREPAVHIPFNPGADR